jgi:hypothetical protein
VTRTLRAQEIVAKSTRSRTSKVTHPSMTTTDQMPTTMPRHQCVGGDTPF